MSTRHTHSHFQKLKRQGQRFACLTAYDATTARLLDEAGVPMLLVGDSLGMTVLGYDSTLPVTLDDMLHHTRAVVRGSQHAFILADLPFLASELSDEDTLRNAGRLVQQGGASGIKLEGASPRALSGIQRLTSAGIAVCGHLGLTPQHVQTLGGYKLQGKGETAAQQLLAQARAIEAAGAQAVLLELVPLELGQTITQTLSIPTIGIGAGPHCDGQVLVSDDLLGRYEALSPRFVRRYADMATTTRQAAQAFMADIASGAFPSAAESYSQGTSSAVATSPLP